MSTLQSLKATNVLQMHLIINKTEMKLNNWDFCKILIRRADQLIQEENDDVIPYCIATGDVKKLVMFFTSRGQLKEALLVAQVQMDVLNIQK